MMTTGMFVLSIAIWLVSLAVGLWIAYAVIKAAVIRAALREHTMTSTTAVSVTSAVPLAVTVSSPVA